MSVMIMTVWLQVGLPIVERLKVENIKFFLAKCYSDQSGKENNNEEETCLEHFVVGKSNSSNNYNRRIL